MTAFIHDGKASWYSRWLVLIALLVLFGLPAVSWFYLKEGVRFRQRIHNELIPKDTLTAQARLIMGADTLTWADLAGDVIVLWQEPGKDLDAKQAHTAWARADTLWNVFGAIPRVRMLVWADAVPERQQPLPSAGWQRAWPADEAMTSLWPDSVRGLRALVADTALVVRHYYDLSQRRAWAKLAEHLAVLIPQPPKPDIVLKREKEK